MPSMHYSKYMNKIVGLAPLLLVCSLVACTGSSRATSGSDSIATLVPIALTSEEEAEEMAFIRSFYDAGYTDEWTDDTLRHEAYLGAELIALLDSTIADGEVGLFDYDPFTQAQDYNRSTLLESLRVKPTDRPHLYRVSLASLPDADTVSIDLLLGRDRAGSLRIVNIPSDSICRAHLGL